MGARDQLENCIGFDWDEDNASKNWDRHQVTPEEAGQVFFLDPLIVRGDRRHSKGEIRYYALGQTDAGRLLFVALFIRRQLIRVISVRDMNRNEARIYAIEEQKANS